MVRLEEERGAYRRGPSALGKVEFCIHQLRNGDWENDIDWRTDIVPRLTIEEVVGALLHARDRLQEYNEKMEGVVEKYGVGNIERITDDIRRCFEHHRISPKIGDVKGHKDFLPQGISPPKIPDTDHKARVTYEDGTKMITHHPYNLSMEKLKQLIEACEKHGWKFHIEGHSCYYPNKTFCIEFYRESDIHG